MDMQKEQQVSRRGFVGHDFNARLSGCAEVLANWRANNWPIIHLKRVAQAAWFNPVSSLTSWIEGWTPLPGEEVFEHSLPSAYSSQRFAEFMNNLHNTSCCLIGFSLEEAILATAVDAFHRGHDIRVMEKAAFAQNNGVSDDIAYRKVLVGVVGKFAQIEPANQSLRA